MTEEERKKAEQELKKDEKQLLGVLAASLVTGGLLGGVAGYSMGYEAGVKENKPVTTTVYGGQTIINNHNFRVNSSD